MSNVINLNSDQPKTKKEQDGLGFADSAESVAKSIFNNDFSDGFVIGIEGEWGSGKTTYINFILEYLKNNHPEFKILEFNPWLHSSHKNLIAAYFKLLSKEANDIFGDNSIKENLANVVDSFTPVLSNLASLGGLGGTTKSVMGSVSKKLKESPTLESQYEIIQKKLTEAEKPFVVIIDDLDRLDSDEIKTMLKLVKSVGRLPYVTYILTYDREYVTNATNADMPHFLEKIIQLSISLPKPTKIKLIQMLFKDLEVFSKNINKENETRFNELLNSTLRPHLKKPRHIALLANAINFKLPTTKDILDPVDLFALECLYLFDKNLWDWIRDSRDIILGEGDYRLLQYEKETFKKHFEASLSKLSSVSENQKTTLSLLFPNLAKIIDENSYYFPENNHNTRKRNGIAVNAVYDAYFSQHLDKTAILQSDIDSFLENSHDKEKTIKTLRSWIDKKDAQGISKIAEFLDSLHFSFENKTSPKPDKMLLWPLIDICDDINLLAKSLSSLSMPIQWQILSVFTHLFEQIGKQETKEFLQDICNDKARISAAAFLLYRVGNNMGKMRNEDDTGKKRFLIEEADWEPLTKIIAPHIKSAFLTGTVGDFAKVIFAELFATHIFGDKIAQDMFKTAYKKSEKYVIKTVKEHLRYVTTGSGERGYEFATENYKEPIQPYIMEEYAKKVNLEKQDEDTKEAITVFLDGMHKHDDDYKNAIL